MYEVLKPVLLEKEKAEDRLKVRTCLIFRQCDMEVGVGRVGPSS